MGLGRHIINLAIALLALALMLIVAHQLNFDTGAFIGTALTLDPALITLILLVTAAEFILKVERFRHCLAGARAFEGLAVPYLIGSGLSMLVPFRLLGEGVRPIVFKSSLGISYGESISAISIERAFDMLLITLFLALAFSSFIHPPVAIAVFAIFLVFILVARSGRLGKAASAIPHKAISEFASSYLGALSSALRGKRKFRILSFYTAIIWLGAFLRLWLITAAFGVQLPYFSAASASAVSYVLSLFSILPGGMVLFEGGGTAVLMRLGVDAGTAFSAMLIERLFSFWILVFPSILLFPRYAKRLNS